jgi:hypothetical protein
MPAGEEVIVPLPVPVTFRVVVRRAANREITALLPSIVTVQVEPEPVHEPDHPLKAKPGFGVGLRVMIVPESYLLLHATPQ